MNVAFEVEQSFHFVEIRSFHGDKQKPSDFLSIHVYVVFEVSTLTGTRANRVQVFIGAPRRPHAFPFAWGYRSAAHSVAGPRPWPGPLALRAPDGNAGDVRSRHRLPIACSTRRSRATRRLRSPSIVVPVDRPLVLDL